MQAFNNLITKVNQNILNPLIALLFGFAVIYFLWGVFEYIRDYDNAEARSTGAQHILWGVIGMSIMVSVFGIMNLIANTLGLG